MPGNGSASRLALPMSENAGGRMHEAVDAVYRAESRRVFATLVRLVGDFDLAEEALHDAFRAALEQWPRDGVPANPRAWLVSAGRFKAIDGIHVAPGSTRSTRTLSNSRRPRTRSRGAARTSRTTGCG